MTTPEPRARRTLSTGRLLVAGTAAVLAVGALWLAFTLAGEPDTAAGALVGGGGFIVLMAVLRWRAARQGPSSASGFGRALLGTADERDKTIFSSSLAYVGLAAFLANAVGMAAVALGADGATVIGAIEWLLLAVLVGSSIVLSRRL
ncbi:hypothetical protein [Cellulomonas fengjieae]|uniref:MFS transporter n=1 Tax=Cellulomonas fengjieae TaxID=2819978 RepID=A0ABS3SGD9_9CELL|nr:hypothetical protein [Cellulomonas fengjieae]MBO3084820.1 hypothetical protein [Cellulomonas fengjieae]MBO3103785.1 hypothetical protein [Cellulomonas fengjieae]QVI66864.1 hypothetical protein KG102_04555 [Cellulomonas fengjieae]